MKLCLRCWRRWDCTSKKLHIIAPTAANILAVTSERHGLAVTELYK